MSSVALVAVLAPSSGLQRESNHCTATAQRSTQREGVQRLCGAGWTASARRLRCYVERAVM